MTALSLRLVRYGLLSLGLIAFTSASWGDTMERLRSNKKIVVAYSKTSSPFSLEDANGQPVGYAIDICSYIIDAMRKRLNLSDLKVEYVTPALQERLEGVRSGKIDMGCGSTARNAERLRLVDFSRALYIGPLRTLVKSNTPWNSFKDLGGKTLAVPMGTESEKVARRLDAEASLKLVYKLTKTSPEGFEALKRGAADAFMMDDVVLATLRSYTERPEDFRFLDDMQGISEIGILLPKGDAAFKAFVDQELVRLMREGEAVKLYNKWFQSPIPPLGKNLNLPLNRFLREHFKYPTDGFIVGR